MKIAITGGAGFIGRHLTKAYLDAGHNVLVIDNLAGNIQQQVDPRARLYRLDIRDTLLSTILQQERPDIVSHHVSQPRSIVPHEQLISDADVHIRGLLHVLQSCANAPSIKKFIFASSGNSLYSGSAQMPVNEEALLSPRSAYDISKVSGEWYVRHYTRNYGLQHTILRYADVYAAEPTMRQQTTHPLHYFVGMLARQCSPIIRGTGRQIHDHIFIDDIVQANIRALTLGNNRTFNIGSGQGYSLNQLFEITANLLQCSIKPTYISGSPEDDDAIALDNTRAQRYLRWQPEVSLQDGIQRLIKQSDMEIEPPQPERSAYASEVSSISAEEWVLTRV